MAQWRDSELFSARERAALGWAEAVTLTCADIESDAVDRLRDEFSENEITALTAWIGFQNMSAKFNAALGAEEHGFCALPGKDDQQGA